MATGEPEFDVPLGLKGRAMAEAPVGVAARLISTKTRIWKIGRPVPGL